MRGFRERRGFIAFYLCLHLRSWGNDDARICQSRTHRNGREGHRELSEVSHLLQHTNEVFTGGGNFVAVCSQNDTESCVIEGRLGLGLRGLRLVGRGVSL